MWGSEQEVTVKDEILLSTPSLLYPNIFCDSSIFYSPCENIFMNVSTFDHSQNAWDVSLSFDYGEDKSFFPDPLDLSYFISGNSEGEFFFSLTPLCDSLDHEDVIFHPEYYDHGCLDIFTHSFDHDSDSPTVDLSKPSDFYDPSFDEVETPKTVKEL